MKRIELKEGDRYNMLVYIKEAGSKKNNLGKSIRYIECLCDCGKTTIVPFGNIRNNNTKSCGCFVKINSSRIGKVTGKQLNEKYGKIYGFKKGQEPINKIHGDSSINSKYNYLYNTWKNMLFRCYNIKCNMYINYGGRGIKVYDEWHNYIKFKEYIIKNLGERPNNYSIDRFPNNDSNYEPNNIRWANQTEQMYNKRPSRKKKEI